MDPRLRESLERTLNEIDALEAIYSSISGDNEEGSQFSVISKSDLAMARDALENVQCENVPQLDIEVQTIVRRDSAKGLVLRLRCSLPPGYPQVAATVVASVDGLKRSSREELSQHLNRKAEAIVGMEAVMDLMEEFKFVAPTYLEEKTTDDAGAMTNGATSEDLQEMFGRRWIWVHHIKDTSRRKSIVTEARNLNLGGYLKFGYPGIVLVEGKATSCDEFVSWIKGNKSRPGGFGRNWGHHCRGELNFSKDLKALPATFEELEDLAALGGLCKDFGLEDEFLQFVMQHKGTPS